MTSRSDSGEGNAASPQPASEQHELHELDFVPGAHIHTTVIGPRHGWLPLNIHEVWEYRELLYFFVWRDLKVRYKQTALGAAWAIIQPFMTMVVFSIFFGQLVGVSSGSVPYPIFSYSALIPWTYFANALNHASNSLVAHERMITKVYFPRLLLPISAVLAGLVDLGIAAMTLFGMMLYYRITPGAALWTLPLFTLFAVATATGVGLWLAVWNVRYRDVRYAVTFLINFWLFATPVAYSSELVPPQWRALYGLNPMVGVVDGFRWALLGQGTGPGPLLLISVLTTTGVLIGGLYYFRRQEQTFADEI